MHRRLLLLALPLLLAAKPVTPPTARVRIDTSMGPIVVDLDLRHAPVTAGNFLAYVDDRKFDGAQFYRAVKGRRDPNSGFVQGGVNHVAAHSRFPIEHEPTSKTGIHHVDGTISMARNDVGTAAGDFFIILGDERYLDARPGYPGYAAFGHVVQGMDLVRRIQKLPCWPGGFSEQTVGQTLRTPIRILSARRVP